MKKCYFQSLMNGSYRCHSFLSCNLKAVWKGTIVTIDGRKTEILPLFFFLYKAKVDSMIKSINDRKRGVSSFLQFSRSGMRMPAKIQDPISSCISMNANDSLPPWNSYVFFTFIMTREILPLHIYIFIISYFFLLQALSSFYILLLHKSHAVLLIFWLLIAISF